MSECTIKITTSVDGAESYFSSRAEIGRNGKDGYTVKYIYDGDECTMQIGDDAVVQMRRGSLNMDASFISDRTTVLSIDDEDGRADVPVICKKVSCECFRRGIFCSLEYAIEPSEFVVRIAIITKFDLKSL